MDQLSDNTSLGMPTQTTIKHNRKRKTKILCSECNQRRELLEENHHICGVCYKAKLAFIPSGNKVIDDFIMHTLTSSSKLAGKMVFVPYNQFKDVKFIARGGFSEIYKAIWIDGPVINKWIKKNQSFYKPEYNKNYEVVLKKLNNSKEITSKALNELKIFHEFSLNWKKRKYNVKNKNYNEINNYISKYFGITQEPVTKDIMIIMPYYNLGDLVNYLTNDFYSIEWHIKLKRLKEIINGLANVHSVNILHRDFHSGNIFCDGYETAYLGDLGLSKSATEFTDDDNNNENYGIIPYMAPEIFKGQKYTKESDIYSFGMIMWEFMTGRRPFWNRSHDAELIIEICDGLRPPIVTNAPEGYIELMKECWNSDPNKRPEATDIYNRIDKMWLNESRTTKIIKSSEIGPVTTNNPGAIYRSRFLSGIIQSAMFTMSTRSLRSESITAGVGKYSIKYFALIKNNNN
ncbi:Bck1p [Rhizophagus irregularis DAOM 197198w]|uniref:Bck1p n=2 Tax=Rhizophagus irregularis TaxID=588596 RepID=A0A015K475_RHIIW|nr:Bck1p [Rhizophagus irregularis DAOM 197198w]